VIQLETEKEREIEMIMNREVVEIDFFSIEKEKEQRSTIKGFFSPSSVSFFTYIYMDIPFVLTLN
jgi:hypothetical protein